MRDCIIWSGGREATEYQQDIGRLLVRDGRLAVRSCHGAGKTAVVALLVLWFAETRDGEDWKVPMTASVWRQLKQFLLPEIRKWARRLNWEILGRDPYDERTELLQLMLHLDTGSAFAMASDDPTSIEGVHADQLLYIFDESKAIPAKMWEAAEGAFSNAGEGTGHEAYWLAVSTPGEPAGTFFDIHSRKPGYEDWQVRHVTIDEVIAAGRVTQDWVNRRKRQWGEKSAVFQNRVLGNFASDDANSVIPLAWVELANERWYEWNARFNGNKEYHHEYRRFLTHYIDALGYVPADEESYDSRFFDDLIVLIESDQIQPPKNFYGESDPAEKFTCVGVDVADEGEDLTVLAMRYGWICKDIRYPPKEKTPSLTERIAGILRRYGGYAMIDAGGGWGAGVVYALEEGIWNQQKGNYEQFEAYGFVGAEKTDFVDRSGELRFRNKRAASYWNMRQLLDPDLGVPIALPPDDLLTGDLTAPRWKMTPGGILLESKEDIKARIGRSTDTGDAVTMAFFDDVYYIKVVE